MLTRPIFVLGCNRSGTTLLFRNLSMHPDLWSLYIEAQEQFHRHWPVDDELGDRVEEPASPVARGALVRDLFSAAHNKERFRDVPLLGSLPARLFQRPLGRLYRRAPIRLVEKTPANTLRVPMLARTFADARFLFLVRRGEDVVSSLMEGWKRWSGTADAATWRFTKWHYLVPPGWRQWVQRHLEEICAYQWAASTTTAKLDLERWAPDRYLQLRHEDLLADPAASYGQISDFCELRNSPSFRRAIDTATERVYTTGGSAPRSRKWKRMHQAEILRVREVIESLNSRFYEDPSVE